MRQRSRFHSETLMPQTNVRAPPSPFQAHYRVPTHKSMHPRFTDLSASASRPRPVPVHRNSGISHLNTTTLKSPLATDEAQALYPPPHWQRTSDPNFRASSVKGATPLHKPVCRHPLGVNKPPLASCPMARPPHHSAPSRSRSSPGTVTLHGLSVRATG